MTQSSSIIDALLVNVSTSVYLSENGQIVGTKGDFRQLIDRDESEILDAPLESFIDPQYSHVVSSLISYCLQSGESKTARLRFHDHQHERELLFVPKDISALNWPEEAAVKFLDVTHYDEHISRTLLPVDVFHTMLKVYDEGIILLDNQGHLKNINAQAALILGVNPEHIIEKKLADFLPFTSTASGKLIIEEILNGTRETDSLSKSTIPLSDQSTILLNFLPIRGNDESSDQLVVSMQIVTGDEESSRSITKIYEKLNLKIRIMSIHNSLSSDFNICNDGSQLFPRLTRTLAVGLGIHDTIAIFSWRKNAGDPFMIRSCFGISEEQAKLLGEKPEEIAQHVFLPVDQHPQYAFLAELGLKYMIYAPIIIDRVTIGYLSVFRKQNGYSFDEEEILLKILADNVRHFLVRLRAESELRDKVVILSRLLSINDAYQLCQNREQIAYAFLSSVTAEQGLRFNRAFLFLRIEEKKELECSLALGPENPGEAEKIWQELRSQNLDFDQLLQDFQRIEKIKESPLHQKFGGRRHKYLDNGFLSRSILAGAFRVTRLSEIDDARDRRFFEELGCSEFLLAPLVTKERFIGLLIADNAITGFPLGADLLRYAEIICKTTQQTLEQMRLYERLQDSVEKLGRSNKLLQDNRDKIYNLERLSAIGQMAATVAHEIRNPLVSIGGFARTLTRHLQDDDPNARFAEIIYTEVGRLERVINDLLDFAKPIQINLLDVSLREVILQVLDIVRPEFERAGVKVRTRMAQSQNKSRLDPDLLRQLMLNLLNNALEAMHDGDIMTISTSEHQDFIRIRVIDTGVGIPEKNVAKLFEAFFTTKKRGTGLGLAIVKNIVFQHGGKINIKSKEHHGTEFIVDLPRDPAQNQLRKNGAAQQLSEEDYNEQ